jgi:thioredoxin reductase
VFFAHRYRLSRDECAQLSARGIRVEHGEVTRLVVENDRLTGVQLADGRIVVRAAVFIRPDNRPHNDGLLERLGCAMNEDGFPIVDPTGRTTIPGVYAAGNARDPRAQVITAAGQASAAAIAINSELVEEAPLLTRP